MFEPVYFLQISTEYIRLKSFCKAIRNIKAPASIEILLLNVYNWIESVQKNTQFICVQNNNNQSCMKSHVPCKLSIYTVYGLNIF